VVDVPAVEIVLVEEVAERTVSDVVEKPGHAHRLLDQRHRGRAAVRGRQRGIEVAGPVTGQVHRAKRVLEARVLGGREHPPRALQLVDAAQPLQPRGVDEVLLRGLAGHAAWPALGDAKVAVDWVAEEVDPRVLGRRRCHLRPIMGNG